MRPGRIGEALGLRHEDLAAAEREVAVVPRDNDNGARSKSREPRLIPVSAGLIRLYADYLHGEYGDLDCDYVFVNLWGQPHGHPLGYLAVYDLVRRLRRRTGIGFDPHWCRHILFALFPCGDSRHRRASGPAACAVRVPSPRCRLSRNHVRWDSLQQGRPTATRMTLNTASAGTRHTAATRMLRDGVPIEVVSRLLGHADLTTTSSVYGHLTVEDARKALEQAGWFTGQEVRL